MKLLSVRHCVSLAALAILFAVGLSPTTAEPPAAPVPPIVAEPGDKPGEAWITVNGQRVLVKIGAVEPAKQAENSLLNLQATAWPVPEPAPNDPFDVKYRDPRSLSPNGPVTAAPGQVIQVVITGTVQPHHYTYPLTKRANNPQATAISTLQAKGDGLIPLWPMRESEPTWHKNADPSIGTYLVHEGTFVWGQDFLIDPMAAPGQRTLRLTVKTQVCDKSTCVPVSQTLDIPIDVSGPPLPQSPTLHDRLKVAQPAVTLVPLPGTTPPSKNDEVDPEPEGDLLPLLLTSVLGAIGMLFTPCVFPMIPITVSFFLKQSEKKHHNAPLTAGVYCLTIIVVLALAVVLLGQLIVVWANSVWLNLALAVMLIVFSLSLFGMYDIELPTFLTKWTSSGEGRGGYLGAVFMALTFTITSFTCTGPFLGPLLVATSQMAGVSFWYRLLAAFAYAATFAAPFFVLALFPGLLKKLPKSGGWLNAVKVVMGFLELAAALKFLGNVDVTLNPGSPWLFTYDTVLVSWIALSAACGLYLLGLFRLPHDTPQEHVGVPRMVLATIFLGLAVYISPALWRETPTGILGQGLVAFLPYDSRPAPAAKGGGEAVQEFMDYQQAWEAAKKENKLIFIDFTGVQCTNCISNERNVFTLPEVRKEREKYVVVRLYTDSVPGRGLSAAQASEQADFNKRLQSNTFGNITLPLYVMFDPDRQTPIADDRLLGQILGKEEGLITDVNTFLEKLRKPLQGREAK